MKLTEKQRRFIDYYIELGNATRAAKKAGYSAKTANRIGAENLSKLDFVIQERLAANQDDRIASRDEVLATITGIMRDESAGTKERLKAAELLAKRYGLLRDKPDSSESGDSEPKELIVRVVYGKD